MSAVSQPRLKAPRASVQQRKFQKGKNKAYGTHGDSRVINNGLFYRPVEVRRRFTRSDESQHLYVYVGNTSWVWNTPDWFCCHCLALCGLTKCTLEKKKNQCLSKSLTVVNVGSAANIELSMCLILFVHQLTGTVKLCRVYGHRPALFCLKIKTEPLNPQHRYICGTGLSLIKGFVKQS